jgi:uncharacterized protein (TIGR02646 family)
MRKVDRRAVEVPASLVPHREGRKRQSKGAIELERNTLFFEGKKPTKPNGDPITAMSFDAYGEDSVKTALHALFHGKCAYCESSYESTAPVDVEHFRPKGRVAEDENHPGYWWLAADWDNLLPSCIDCNRRRRQRLTGPDGSTSDASTGKQDQFPVLGHHLTDRALGIETEQPLLIDPCRDDPARHLGYRVVSDPLLALILPQDAPDALQRGEAAIRVHGLNRLALVQERTRLLRRLDLLRTVLARLDEAAALISTSPDPAVRQALTPIDLAVSRLLDDIRAMAADTEPYSTLVAQWLHHWAKDLTAVET